MLTTGAAVLSQRAAPSGAIHSHHSLFKTVNRGETGVTDSFAGSRDIWSASSAMAPGTVAGP